MRFFDKSERIIFADMIDVLTWNIPIENDFDILIVPEFIKHPESIKDEKTYVKVNEFRSAIFSKIRGEVIYY